MPEVTCAQFQSFLADAAARLALTWQRSRAEHPELFSETLELEEWWDHFAKEVMPQVMARRLHQVGHRA